MTTDKKPDCANAGATASAPGAVDGGIKRIGAGDLAVLHSALSRAQMITAEAAMRLRRHGFADTAMHAELFRITEQLVALEESLQPTVLD